MTGTKDIIHQAIEQTLGISVSNGTIAPISGGSINQAFRYQNDDLDLFVKINSAAFARDMFECEKRGLALLESHSNFKIPRVLGTGKVNEKAFLLLEFIPSYPVRSDKYWSSLAASLAKLHRATHFFFGLDHDNFIGPLVQKNDHTDNWKDFFFKHRLEPLVRQACRQKYLESAKTSQGLNKLYNEFDSIVPEEKAALLHGDLWSGNQLCYNEGEPVVFDPAVYYGHREMDIAMTKLFGGFTDRFYQEYVDRFPLEAGWQERAAIHNLYPLLVHTVLFGTGYAQDVKHILRSYQ